jgi:hypothetical protein
MNAWIAKRLDELAREELDGFVFKSRSPSCGVGTGLWARAFAERFPLAAVEDEAGLQDATRRRAFLARITARGDGERR